MAGIDFTGNLAKDPESHVTHRGRQVTRLRVIENRRQQNPDTGEWEDAEPNVFRVQALDALAVNAAESLRTGTTVTVKGHVVTDRWHDKDTGEDRTAQVVIADSLGVDLRWQQAEVTKAPRMSPGAPGTPQDQHE